MSIPPEEFSLIMEELKRQPLPVNEYRTNSGIGRSQAFGVVNRRSLSSDYSRWCWKRPYLYKLLLDFGAKYVTEIKWNAITVNINYQASRHLDRGNGGDSFLVAFGDYSGGGLKIWKKDETEEVLDINCKPVIGNFCEIPHAVEPFTGDRYSLVFYYNKGKKNESVDDLPPPSVVLMGKKYVFKRGDKICVGLPHVLKRKKS